MQKTIEIDVIRYSDGGQSTIGIFFIDGVFECHTLEDQFRDVKVYADTRIPAGRYKITLRTEGKFHESYKKRFPAIHKGMLWIRDVPGFEYILIHIGNDEKDTAGCLLIGLNVNQNIYAPGQLENSTDAYLKLYPKIANHLSAGGEVFINYHDVDRNFRKYFPTV